ncbi:alpha/beta hydrolase [Brevundimonas goettingensis]|uniref:Alpha/beta hydrolase n=1 Tax=Brevundimonas goettingensis TaxID=2774190 RepID=A0A975C2G5_9CAUL|nr:alpha/beta hydrolase [Brevundimonas goettingensis]QTC92658.1 alpha/beta hydrolase [Brevundimonas goettingensis]
MLIRVLAAGLLLSVAPMTAAVAQTAPAAAAPAFEARHLMIPAPDGRTIDISVWAAPEERGVIVFSSGFNSAPAAYHRILSEWVSHGYTVVAPLHVDSLQHPDHDKYDNRAAFSTRIMDVAVARGVARHIAPGKPMIAAGHSFGSLISAIEGGAVTVAGPHGDPEIKGVIELSSPGIIQGLVTPTTWEGLDKPLLVITGDKDVVPGFATDWHDHRAAFDGSPAGDKTLLIFADGDHSLIARADDADFATIVEATEAFLDAYALGDAAAKARLNALPAPDGVTIERR